MCLMSDIINLNKFRKARKRRDGQTDAAQNRVLHGRTKAQKDKSRKLEMREKKELDGKRLVTPPGQEPEDPA